MAGENASFLNMARKACPVKENRYVRAERDALAWSVCDPQYAEIDTPAESALALLSRE